VLLADKEEEMKNMVERFERYLNAKGLKLNVESDEV